MGKTILIITLTLISFCFPISIFAQTAENSLYKVEIEIINTFADPSDTKDINKDQENAGSELTGLNYKIDLGRNYSPSTIPFTFSISAVKIDFGTLSPTNPVTRNTILKIKNTRPIGYKVSGAENHELTEPKSGSIIPDTTCDNGKCTEYRSAQWNSTLTYGFGYRCDSSKPSCSENDTQFQNKDNYMQLANNSKDEGATTILSEGSSFGQEASITFKANIPSSQPQGPYTNTVTFLAIPNY